MSTPGWMEHAACTRPEAQGLPWTTDSIELPEVIVELMRSTCDSCAVRTACNSYAIEEGVSGGMWAGTDRDQVVPLPVPLPVGSTPVLGEQLELPLSLGDAIAEVLDDLDAPVLDGAA